MLLLILVYKMWWLLRVSKLRFRDSIMQLSTNGYPFKPQKTQITTPPQMISLPLSTFFSSNTELIYPCFRTVRSSIFYFLKRVLKNVTNQSSIWNWVVSYLFFSFWCIPSFLLTYLLWVLFLSFQVLYVMYKGIINMMPIQHDLTFLSDHGGQTLLHPLKTFKITFRWIYFFIFKCDELASHF